MSPPVPLSTNRPLQGATPPLGPPVGEADKPPAPKPEVKPPSPEALRKLEAALKKLGVDLKGFLDAKGELKPDKVEQAKSEVSKKLAAGVCTAAGLKKTAFPLLSKADQEKLLKDAGVKDAEKILAEMQKDFDAPHKKIAHFVRLQAAQAKEENRDNFAAARFLEQAAEIDPGNKEYQLDAARALQAWAEKEPDPKVKGALYEGASRLLGRAVKLDPENAETRLEYAHLKLGWSNHEEDAEAKAKLIQEGRAEIKLILLKNPDHHKALQALAFSLDVDPSWLDPDGSVNETKQNLVGIALRGDGPRSLNAAVKKLGLEGKIKLPLTPEDAKKFQKELLASAYASTELGLLPEATQKSILKEFLSKNLTALEKVDASGIEASEENVDLEVDKVLVGIDDALAANAEMMTPAQKLAHVALLAAKDAKEKGNLDRAEQLYEAAEQFAPAEPGFNEEINPQAAKIYKKLVELGVRSSELDSNRKGDSYGRIDPKEVFKYVGDHFDDPDVQTALKAAEIKLPKDASEKVKELGGFDKMMVSYHYGEQLRFKGKGEFFKSADKIAEHLTAACYYEPDNKYNYQFLAEFYQAQMGNPDKPDGAFAYNIPAARAYAAAYKLDPETYGPKLSGMVLDATDEALKNADQLEKEGKFAAAAQLLSQAALLHDIRNEADPKLDKVPTGLDLRQKNAQIHLKLGKLADRLDEKAAAKQAYQKAVENADAWIKDNLNSPGCIEAYGIKAEAQDAMGDYTGAYKSLLKQANCKKLIIQKLPHEDMSEAIRKSDSNAEKSKYQTYGLKGLKADRLQWVSYNVPTGNYIPSEAHDIELETPSDYKATSHEDPKELDKIPNWARGNLAEYQKKLESRLKCRTEDRKTAQAKQPPDLREIADLLADEVRLLDTLGRGKEAQDLVKDAEKFRNQAEVAEKTNLVQALTEKGIINHESVMLAKFQRDAESGGMQSLNHFVTFEAQAEGSCRLGFTDAYDSLNDKDKKDVLDGLAVSGERLQWLNRAREAKGPDKLFYEAKMAVLDGEMGKAREKLVEFKTQAKGNRDAKVKILLQKTDELLENLGSPEGKPPNQISDDIKILLGSLVQPTHRDARGALNLEMMKGIENFDDFKRWLATQASVDGKVLNQIDSDSSVFASHDKLLKNPKYEPLLKMLWAEVKKDPSQAPKLSPQQLQNLSTDFNRDMARMSFSRFVSNHMGTAEGLKKLEEMLKDTVHYDKEFRADLLEEIMDVGEAQGHVPPHVRANFEKQISTYWDDRIDPTRMTGYFHTGEFVDATTYDEVHKATRYGLQVLKRAAQRQSGFSQRHEKYLNHPQEVQMLQVKHGDMVLRPFSYHTLQKMARIVEQDGKKSDGPSQMRAKLANMWLLVADNENWTGHTKKGDYVNEHQRLYMLCKAASFIERTKTIKTNAEFVAFNHDLHMFLNGQGTPVVESDFRHAGAAQFMRDWNKVKEAIQQGTSQIKLENVKNTIIDVAPLGVAGELLKDNLKSSVKLEGTIDLEWSIGTTVHDLFDGIDPAVKGGYTELREMSDGYWAMEEMEPGTIDVVEPEIRIADPKLREKVVDLVQGLRDTKRGLWYQYKQQGWLYRTATHGPSWSPHKGYMYLGEEDPEIRETIGKANKEIDGLIRRLSAARSPAEVEAQIKILTQSMNSEGPLHKALSGVDASLGKELFSIAQVVIEMFATEIVTAGLGHVAAAGRALKVMSYEAIATRSIGAGFEAFGSVWQAQKLAKAGKLAEASKAYEKLFDSVKSVGGENLMAKSWLNAEMKLAQSEKLSRIESKLDELEDLAGKRPKSSVELSKLIRKHKLDPKDYLEADDALRTFLSPAALAKAKSLHGFSTGMKMSAMGNLMDKASGGLRTEPDQISNWFVQALATGFSMAVTGPFEGELRAARKALAKPGTIKGWYQHYLSRAGFKEGAKALGKKLVDFPPGVFKEAVEEVLENQTLQWLQMMGDPTKGPPKLSEDEFRQIVIICAAGQGQAESKALLRIGGDIYKSRRDKKAPKVEAASEPAKDKTEQQAAAKPAPTKAKGGPYRAKLELEEEAEGKEKPEPPTPVKKKPAVRQAPAVKKFLADEKAKLEEKFAAGDKVVEITDSKGKVSHRYITAEGKESAAKKVEIETFQEWKAKKPKAAVEEKAPVKAKPAVHQAPAVTKFLADQKANLEEKFAAGDKVVEKEDAKGKVSHRYITTEGKESAATKVETDTFQAWTATQAEAKPLAPSTSPLQVLSRESVHAEVEAELRESGLFDLTRPEGQQALRAIVNQVLTEEVAQQAMDRVQAEIRQEGKLSAERREEIRAELEAEMERLGLDEVYREQTDEVVNGLINHATTRQEEIDSGDLTAEQIVDQTLSFLEIPTLQESLQSLQAKEAEAAEAEVGTDPSGPSTPTASSREVVARILGAAAAVVGFLGFPSTAWASGGRIAKLKGEAGGLWDSTSHFFSDVADSMAADPVVAMGFTSALAVAFGAVAVEARRATRARDEAMSGLRAKLEGKKAAKAGESSADSRGQQGQQDQRQQFEEEMEAKSRAFEKLMKERREGDNRLRKLMEAGPKVEDDLKFPGRKVSPEGAPPNPITLAKAEAEPFDPRRRGEYPKVEVPQKAEEAAPAEATPAIRKGPPPLSLEQTLRIRLRQLAKTDSFSSASAQERREKCYVIVDELIGNDVSSLHNLDLIVDEFVAEAEPIDVTNNAKMEPPPLPLEARFRHGLKVWKYPDGNYYFVKGVTRLEEATAAELNAYLNYKRTTAAKAFAQELRAKLGGAKFDEEFGDAIPAFFESLYHATSSGGEVWIRKVSKDVTDFMRMACERALAGEDLTSLEGEARDLLEGYFLSDSELEIKLLDLIERIQWQARPKKAEILEPAPSGNQSVRDEGAQSAEEARREEERNLENLNSAQRALAEYDQGTEPWAKRLRDLEASGLVEGHEGYDVIAARAQTEEIVEEINKIKEKIKKSPPNSENRKHLENQLWPLMTELGYELATIVAWKKKTAELQEEVTQVKGVSAKRAAKISDATQETRVGSPPALDQETPATRVGESARASTLSPETPGIRGKKKQPKDRLEEIEIELQNELREAVLQEVGKSVDEVAAQRIIRLMEDGTMPLDWVHQALGKNRLALLAKTPGLFEQQLERDMEIDRALGGLYDGYFFVNQMRRKHGLGEPTSLIEALAARMYSPHDEKMLGFEGDYGIEFKVRTADEVAWLVNDLAFRSAEAGFGTPELAVVEKGADFLRLRTPLGGEFIVRVKVMEAQTESQPIPLERRAAAEPLKAAAKKGPSSEEAIPPSRLAITPRIGRFLAKISAGFSRLGEAILDLLRRQDAKTNMMSFLSPNISHLERVLDNAQRLLNNHTLQGALAEKFGPNYRSVVEAAVALSKIGFGHEALDPADNKTYFKNRIFAMEILEKQLKPSLMSSLGMDEAQYGLFREAILRQGTFGIGTSDSPKAIQSALKEAEARGMDLRDAFYQEEKLKPKYDNPLTSLLTIASEIDVSNQRLQGWQSNQTLMKALIRISSDPIVQEHYIQRTFFEIQKNTLPPEELPALEEKIKDSSAKFNQRLQNVVQREIFNKTGEILHQLTEELELSGYKTEEARKQARIILAEMIESMMAINSESYLWFLGSYGIQDIQINERGEILFVSLEDLYPSLGAAANMPHVKNFHKDRLADILWRINRASGTEIALKEQTVRARPEIYDKVLASPKAETHTHLKMAVDFDLYIWNGTILSHDARLYEEFIAKSDKLMTELFERGHHLNQVEVESLKKEAESRALSLHNFIQARKQARGENYQDFDPKRDPASLIKDAKAEFEILKQELKKKTGDPALQQELQSTREQIGSVLELIDRYQDKKDGIFSLRAIFQIARATTLDLHNFVTEQKSGRNQTHRRYSEIKNKDLIVEDAKEEIKALERLLQEGLKKEGHTAETEKLTDQIEIIKRKLELYERMKFHVKNLFNFQEGALTEFVPHFMAASNLLKIRQADELPTLKRITKEVLSRYQADNVKYIEPRFNIGKEKGTLDEVLTVIQAYEEWKAVQLANDPTALIPEMRIILSITKFDDAQKPHAQRVQHKTASVEAVLSILQEAQRRAEKNDEPYAEFSLNPTADRPSDPRVHSYAVKPSDVLKYLAGMDAAGQEEYNPPSLFFDAFRLIEQYNAQAVAKGRSDRVIGCTFHVSESNTDVSPESALRYTLDATYMKPYDHVDGDTKPVMNRLGHSIVTGISNFGKLLGVRPKERAAERLAQINHDLKLLDFGLPLATVDRESLIKEKQELLAKYPTREAQENTVLELPEYTPERIRDLELRAAFVRDELIKLDVVVETNPTSNLGISPYITGYQNHTLKTFLSYEHGDWARAILSELGSKDRSPEEQVAYDKARVYLGKAESGIWRGKKVRVTINTDDLTLFGTSMTEEFYRMAVGLGLSPESLDQLIREGFQTPIRMEPALKEASASPRESYLQRQQAELAKRLAGRLATPDQDSALIAAASELLADVMAAKQPGTSRFLEGMKQRIQLLADEFFPNAKKDQVELKKQTEFKKDMMAMLLKAVRGAERFKARGQGVPAEGELALAAFKAPESAAEAEVPVDVLATAEVAAVQDFTPAVHQPLSPGGEARAKIILDTLFRMIRRFGLDDAGNSFYQEAARELLVSLRTIDTDLGAVSEIFSRRLSLCDQVRDYLTGEEPGKLKEILKAVLTGEIQNVDEVRAPVKAEPALSPEAKQEVALPWLQPGLFGRAAKKLAGFLGITSAAAIATTAFMDCAHAMLPGGGEEAVKNPSVMALSALVVLGIFSKLAGSVKRRGKGKGTEVGSEVEGAEEVVERVYDSDVVFEGFKVSSGEEIRNKGQHLAGLAVQVGEVSAKQFLDTPPARDLSAEQRQAVETEFNELATKTAQHFQQGTFTDLEVKAHRRAALAQHVGYLTGELCRNFPDLNEARARAILTQHFEQPGSRVEDLANRLKQAARGDLILGQFVLDANNGWMFAPMGDLEQALNRPGIHAGKALLQFARALAGSLDGAKGLLQRFYDSSPEQLRELLEQPKGELGLIVQFAARAAQTGWLVSKLGQGYVEAIAGKDQKAVSRWTNDLVTPFDQMAAKKGWAEVVKDLDQMRTYLQHLFGDNFSLPQNNRGTHFVTDLEGRRGGIDKLVEAGKLRWVDGKLDFVHTNDPNEKLVFGGDLPDRGPDSIKLVQWLVDLKRRYPERVTLIWGNRDLNKLGLLHDLPRLQTAKDSAYLDWLEAKKKIDPASGQNNLENQVEFWLEARGNKGGLDRHQQELTELLGREVSRREAAQDMVDQVKPGGTFFEYLRLGQVIHADKSVLYVHGGVSPENYGIVPGHTQRVGDARQWVRELNAWGHRELEQIAQAVESKGMGEHVSLKLLGYGDAIWDPEAIKSGGGRGIVFSNDQSVI